MTVKSKPVTVRGDGIECFDVEVSALDTVPVRGYVAKPKNALERSLPIIIQLHAAGVSGDWCKAHAQAAADMARIGAIAFDFNAHGMLNDAKDEYYKALESGRLKNYSYRPITSRNSYYFRGMILRCQKREYLCIPAFAFLCGPDVPQGLDPVHQRKILCQEDQIILVLQYPLHAGHSGMGYGSDASQTI